jgi:hypothetical protein
LNPFGRGKRGGEIYECTATHNYADNPSEVEGRQLSYYASMQEHPVVATSEVSGEIEVARGRCGRSRQSESAYVPVAKKKRCVGTIIYSLKLFFSQLEASVYEAATE